MGENRVGFDVCLYYCCWYIYIHGPFFDISTHNVPSFLYPVLWMMPVGGQRWWVEYNLTKEVYISVNWSTVLPVSSTLVWKQDCWLLFAGLIRVSASVFFDRIRELWMDGWMGWKLGKISACLRRYQLNCRVTTYEYLRNQGRGY